MSETELSLESARNMIDSGAVDQTIGSEDGASLTMESTRRERDESGRFASGSPLFGVEGLEADAGYVPLGRKGEAKSYDSPNEAVGDLEASGAVEPEPDAVPVQWYKTDGSGDPLEPNVTTTVDQAADALSTWHDNVDRYIEGVELAEVASVVDELRAEALKADPKAAEGYGLDPKEVEANAAPLDGVQKGTAEAPAATDNDAEIARAFENPVVVEALRGQFAGVEQAHANLTQQRDAMVRAYELAILNLAPEFRGVTDLNHAASIAQSINAQNPQRWQALQPLLAQGAQLAQVQTQERQAAAARDAESFKAYAAEQDALVGDLSAADLSAAQEYVNEVLKLSPAEMQALTRDRTVRDHRFQRALLDAAKWHQASKASKHLSSRTVPSVQRPGTASGARVSDNSSKLAALNRQLDATKDVEKQLRIARQILDLREAG